MAIKKNLEILVNNNGQLVVKKKNNLLRKVLFAKEKLSVITTGRQFLDLFTQKENEMGSFNCLISILENEIPIAISVSQNYTSRKEPPFPVSIRVFLPAMPEELVQQVSGYNQSQYAHGEELFGAMFQEIINVYNGYSRNEGSFNELENESWSRDGLTYI